MSDTYAPARPFLKGTPRYIGAFLGAAVDAVPYGTALVLQRPDLGTTNLWEVLGLIVGYCACLCPFGVVGGIWSALRRWNCRWEINGEYLLYVDALNRKRDFYVRDIRGLSRNALTGVYQLYDEEGWLLGWFDPVLENSAFLIQYLRERGVGLETGMIS